MVLAIDVRWMFIMNELLSEVKYYSMRLSSTTLIESNITYKGEVGVWVGGVFWVVCKILKQNK